MASKDRSPDPDYAAWAEAASKQLKGRPRESLQRAIAPAVPLHGTHAADSHANRAARQGHGVFACGEDALRPERASSEQEEEGEAAERRRADEHCVGEGRGGAVAVSVG